MTRDEVIELMDEIVRRRPHMAHATHQEWMDLLALLMAEREMGPEPAA